MASLTLKGGRDGIRVHVPQADEFQETLAALTERMEGTGDFFHGASFRFIVEEGELSPEHLRAVAAWAEDHDFVSVTGLHGPSEAATLLAAAPQIETDGEPEPPPQPAGEDGAPARLVVGPLRSGQRVESRGHVVVLGNVNAGAEVVAGGSVFIWGRLQGIVRAGRHLGTSAIVVAAQLIPAQISIGSTTAASSWRETLRGPDSAPAGPEQARADDGTIVIEAWNPIDGTPSRWLASVPTEAAAAGQLDDGGQVNAAQATG